MSSTSFSSIHEYGHWVIVTEPDKWDLMGLWHELKKQIENHEIEGPVKMVSPMPEEGRNQRPVFVVYTARENKEDVGRKLVSIVQKDIYYELKCNFSHTAGPIYCHHIKWDEREPVYVMRLISQ